MIAELFFCLVGAVLFLGGLVLIVAGCWFVTQQSYNNTGTTVVSGIVIVLGTCLAVLGSAVWSEGEEQGRYGGYSAPPRTSGAAHHARHR